MNLSRTYGCGQYNINVFYNVDDGGYEAAVTDRNGYPIFSITKAETPEQALSVARRDIQDSINTALATARGEQGGAA